MLALLAVLVGILHAARVSWVTDDAFISFRYAENLAGGHGLVYNAGERVEGYSNFLWTLWCAAGIALGVAPVRWSVLWGVICYAATLALLARFAASRGAARATAAGAAASFATAPGAAANGRAAAAALPLAAMLGAVDRDWAIFAASGLETALFTLLALAGYLLVLDSPGRPRRAAAAGLAFALAALTRPDGVLFSFIAGAYLLAVSPRRARDLAAFALPLALVLAPYAAWKLAYYGDLLPNTYYAKSADRAWYSQGIMYSGLFFRKYWVLPLGALLCAAAALTRRWPAAAAPGTGGGGAARWNRAAALAAAFALVYTLYVTRVGGDFMYARLLIPVTPFGLILAELAFERLVPARVAPRAAIATALAAGVALTPYPFRGQGWVHGIVNEWEFYAPRERERARDFGLRLREYFRGLPMRVAFCGGQAGLAYYSRAPLAIETATGLTDSTIAHQPLAGRGRVGHEKKTPIPYLIARGTHVWMYSSKLLADSLAPYIPIVPVQLDTLTVMAITWDPPVMDALRARGARMPDFLATLDRFLAVMPSLPDAQVREVYEKTRRFYFDHVRDPRREAPFRARLGLPPP